MKLLLFVKNLFLKNVLLGFLLNLRKLYIKLHIASLFVKISKFILSYI